MSTVCCFSHIWIFVPTYLATQWKLSICQTFLHNYRMTKVKKLLTPLFWSPSSVLHTICATSRSQSASPEINVESVQCVITNVTTQKKNRENFTFHLVYPKSESRYPKYCQNWFFNEIWRINDVQRLMKGFVNLVRWRLCYLLTDFDTVLWKTFLASKWPRRPQK